jgi:hypothetical protein
MISSSGMALIWRVVGTVLSRVLAAMSRMAATFAREKPTARRASSSTSARRAGVGKRPPKKGAETAEDGCGGDAVKLLVSHGADERDEGRARAFNDESARAVRGDEPAHVSAGFAEMGERGGGHW